LSLETKRRIVVGIVLAHALWPFVHFAVRTSFEINPWKFFGWAMYSTVPVAVTLELDPIARGPSEQASERAWSPIVRRVGDVFTRKRKLWGTLIAPDALASAALAERPGIAGVSIRVGRIALDPASAHMVETSRVYHYRRSQGRDPVRVRTPSEIHEAATSDSPRR
jgi:hypothetical protein